MHRVSRLTRPHWGSRLSFMASLLGLTLGTGDVIRLPALLVSEGSGFLIAYAIVMSIIGFPLVTMELALGQFTTAEATDCWSFSPMFQGVGFGMVMITAIVNAYYSIHLALALLYAVKSLGVHIPWTKCDREWASDNCIDFLNITSATQCTENGWSLSNDGACYSSNNFTTKIVALWNVSLAVKNHIPILAADDYFMREVLGTAKSGISLYNLGNIHADLVLCLWVVWSIICISLYWSLQSIVVVIYISLFCVFSFLFVLFIFICTQEGAREGVDNLFSLRYKKLADVHLWMMAAKEVFYTLKCGRGVLICVGGFSNYKADMCMYAFLTTLVNFLTGMICCAITFAVMESIAKHLQVTIHDLPTDVHIGFVVFARALPSLPGGAAWSVLFFLTIFLLGMMSSVVSVKATLSSIRDLSRVLKRNRRVTLMCLCAMYFVTALPMVTDGGDYIVEMVDNSAHSFNLFLLILLECMAITWVYGIKNFVNDISFMVSMEVCGCIKWKHIKYLLAASWSVVCPVVALMFAYHTLYMAITNVSGLERELQITFSVITLAPVPVLAARAVYKNTGICSKRLRLASKPSTEWGPVDPKERAIWLSAHKKVHGGYNRSEYLDFHEEILQEVSAARIRSFEVTINNDPALQSPKLEISENMFVQGIFDTLDPAEPSSVENFIGSSPTERNSAISCSPDVIQATPHELEESTVGLFREFPEFMQSGSSKEMLGQKPELTIDTSAGNENHRQHSTGPMSVIVINALVSFLASPSRRRRNAEGRRLSSSSQKDSAELKN